MISHCYQQLVVILCATFKYFVSLVDILFALSRRSHVSLFAHCCFTFHILSMVSSGAPHTESYMYVNPSTSTFIHNTCTYTHDIHVCAHVACSMCVHIILYMFYFNALIQPVLLVLLWVRVHPVPLLCFLKTILQNGILPWQRLLFTVIDT